MTKWDVFKDVLQVLAVIAMSIVILFIAFFAYSIYNMVKFENCMDKYYDVEYCERGWRP